MSAMVNIEPCKYFREKRDRRLSVPCRKSLPFAESTQGQYSHRVRHVTLHVCLGKTHLAANLWCGMSIIISKKKGRLLAEPSENRPMCATCEGRAIGAGLLGAREIAGRFVMFRPNNNRATGALSEG